MVSGFISRIVILIFGTLYPAYASYKAVRTKNVKEYVKWMMYWIVFALFTCAETFTDLFLGFWFPFYYEIKIITVVYLLSPATKGSSILYRKFVHPVLIKREQEIDEYISKMKEQGYHTMLNLGTKGVNYATSFIMQTAIKGGGGLVNHLRKSYSLNDLSGEQDGKRERGDSADGADYGEDHRLIRRNVVSSTSANQNSLYYPEADISRLPDGDFSHIPYEKMSSRYSSGESYFYGPQQSVGPHLNRTASLGPSSRIRTRASAKQGLPKRSSLSEGGSSWAPMEPRESQNESEHFYNFPLSHSASFPFSYHPLQHLILPEYQQMFGNLTQNHMFTLINHNPPPQILGYETVGLENSAVGGLESIKNDNSTVVLEEKSDDTENETAKENKVLQSDIDVNTVGKNVEALTDCKDKIITNRKEENHLDSEKVAHSNENLEVGEKVIQERLGKYKKKPAPTPPTEVVNSKITNLTVEEEGSAFFTPSASPVPSRKHSSNSDLSVEKISVSDDENEEKRYKSKHLEVSKKSKNKSKKTDFIPKKLHMPKMGFLFWHPKGGKQESTSDTSSQSGVENSSTNLEGRNDLEYFIPLRDDESTTEGSNTTDERL